MANRFILSDGESEIDGITGQTVLGVKKAFVVNDLDLVRLGAAKESARESEVDCLEGMTFSSKANSAESAFASRRTFGIH